MFYFYKKDNIVLCSLISVNGYSPITERENLIHRKLDISNRKMIVYNLLVLLVRGMN